MALLNQEQYKIAWPGLISISTYQKSKKEIIVLKLDIEKVFDKIEHQAMLMIIEQMGFSQTWTSWISNLLCSCTLVVLLNRVPGKTFHCRRGVRQC